ncbi:hypothetical protein [Chitinophaga sp. CF418]|uniref:hypothetical protein n=1 Tax=Chitinophaga sp. CF418 TaxID=1855287 RepID=UPI0009114BB9|nr:hypothetical protein [Chitinophaga sp. CF418]SHN45345.1 hypothetical protein SAMN05216311_1203 [Chitinophaga sp. CF418]
MRFVSGSLCAGMAGTITIQGGSLCSGILDNHQNKSVIGGSVYPGMTGSVWTGISGSVYSGLYNSLNLSLLNLSNEYLCQRLFYQPVQPQSNPLDLDFQQNSNLRRQRLHINTSVQNKKWSPSSSLNDMLKDQAENKVLKLLVPFIK